MKEHVPEIMHRLNQGEIAHTLCGRWQIGGFNCATAIEYMERRKWVKVTGYGTERMACYTDEGRSWYRRCQAVMTSMVRHEVDS